MKLAACMILHYGREWMPWALRSVRPYVDDIIVCYTATPSHGHKTDVPCPEDGEELREIARTHGAYWDPHHSFPFEGAHRDHAVRLCAERGADTVLVVDADEVWDHHTVSVALRHVGENPHVRNWLVPMHHFWRSLNWVCRDAAMPVRLINLKAADGHGYVPYSAGYVHHFGYAQSPAIVEWKWRIHGHLNEMRPGWFEDKFMKWDPKHPMMDVHPTNTNFWNPAAYAKSDIKHLVGDHSYYNMELIK